VTSPNIILTMENIDIISEIYSSKKDNLIFDGISKNRIFLIQSCGGGWDHVYGICSSDNFFKVLKSFLHKEFYKNDKNREFLNHWRWYPRNISYGNKPGKIYPEGGRLIHYYTSRDLTDKENCEFSLESKNPRSLERTKF
jgi:hypothetical protein